MSIKIGTLISENNGGDGVRIEGDVELEVTHAQISENGGHGINALKHAPTMKDLRLPIDTDPMELAKLLSVLQTTSDDQKQEVITCSDLWSKISTGAVDSTALISNIINIASSPHVASIISRLMQ